MGEYGVAVLVTQTSSVWTEVFRSIAELCSIFDDRKGIQLELHLLWYGWKCCSGEPVNIYCPHVRKLDVLEAFEFPRKDQVDDSQSTKDNGRCCRLYMTKHASVKGSRGNASRTPTMVSSQTAKISKPLGSNRSTVSCAKSTAGEIPGIVFSGAYMGGCARTFYLEPFLLHTHTPSPPPRSTPPSRKAQLRRIIFVGPSYRYPTQDQYWFS